MLQWLYTCFVLTLALQLNSLKVTLASSDVKTILDALMYGGELERKTSVSTAVDGTTESSFLYRMAPQTPSISFLSKVPCTVCPVCLILFELFFVLLLCAAYLSLEDYAGVLTGVSWRFDNRRDASPTMMWRFGAPGWVKPTSAPDQQLIHPLGEALRYLSSSANRTQGRSG